MTDEHTTHETSSSRLDALERELDQADPADAPAIAEEIAAILSDALDATEAGDPTTGGPDTADPAVQNNGGSQS
ncbi:MAG: hypothetical protein M5U23_07110 [Acidimicrobiia bacterium]|nr:hypothetical protein [Acidimicrobiia bacterium]